MLFADLPGAHLCALMRARVRITHKYSIEITLYDFDGVYPIEVIWDPCLPSPAKQKALAHKIDAVLLPFYEKVFEMAGLLGEGDTQ
jgi:hypothetical protein